MLSSVLVAVGLAVPASAAAARGDVQIAGVPGQCKVRIVSQANGKTVRAAGTWVRADSTAAGVWEEFWVSDAGNNRFHLQSNGNGRYVSVSAGNLWADSSTKNGTTLFRWEDVDTVNRTFRMVSMLNSNVVRVAPIASGDMVADNQNRDVWATFRYTKVYCL